MKTILVTGGAGFIGGCFVRRSIQSGDVRIINLDALTYAGNLDSIPDPSDRHVFVHGSIGDGPLLQSLFEQHQPDAVIHFAAQSHVDRSIDSPGAFIETNVMGTYQLLQQSLGYWNGLSPNGQQAFRFLHVSTDEVYGSASPTKCFTEATPYHPSSPYSASKAASDHLVQAWNRTYGLPTLITHCSNNYGPYQFPEKLIPLMILHAVAGKPLPVYGDGMHVRDWLYVDDHCRALSTVLDRGQVGQTYNIGGDCQQTNLQIVEIICDAVQEMVPEVTHRCRELITFVTDRPGHDRRYAIDASKIKSELGWQPEQTLQQGIRETVRWYMDNTAWVDRITSGVYRQERLGVL